MKKWKRFLTCGLAALLALGCVACGDRPVDEEHRGGYEGVEEDYAAGVTVSKKARSLPKKGPPEAVSTNLSIKRWELKEPEMH